MRASILCCVVSLGCKLDQGINPDGGGSGGEIDPNAPDIFVDPPTIDFGSLKVLDLEEGVRTVSVLNMGKSDLILTEARLVEETGSGFSAGAPTSVVIQPGARAEIVTKFRPKEHTSATGSLLIASNDPDEAQVDVPMIGAGLAPAIQLDPVIYDFGEVEPGCEVTADVEVKNIGDDTLVVDGFTFVATTPEMSFTAPEGFELEPGASSMLTLTYTPAHEIPVHGVLSVLSNDPARPQVLAEQDGIQAEPQDNVDLFEQPMQPETDILFVIDNSGSMADFQTQLALEAEEFMFQLESHDADWQVGVITIDNPALRGPVITHETANAPEEFANQVQAGTESATEEYQFWRAYQTLQPAGAFRPYLRDEATLSIIIVSDERAQDPGVSRYDQMTEIEVLDYVDFYRSLKFDDDEMLKVHVVGSPTPMGCYPAKEPGWSLEYATDATGGVFLEICSDDWGPGLATIAGDSVPTTQTFHLSEPAVPESIEVRVDGKPTEGLEGMVWWYQDSNNAVTFTEGYKPDGGAEIEIEYTVQGDCEQ